MHSRNHCSTQLHNLFFEHVNRFLFSFLSRIIFVSYHAIVFWFSLVLSKKGCLNVSVMTKCNTDSYKDKWAYRGNDDRMLLEITVVIVLLSVMLWLSVTLRTFIFTAVLLAQLIYHVIHSIHNSINISTRIMECL